MIKDYFNIAFQSLRKRFLRTSLTMLGIFIGIASVVALISLGQGMQYAINSQFASVGSDKVILQGASAGFGPPGQNTAGKVEKRDLDIVKRVLGVDMAAGRLLRSVNIEYGDSTQTIFAASLPGKNQEERNLVIEANNLKVEKGRMLKSDDRKKLIVGYHYWNDEHFSKKLSVGSRISVNGESFEVIGLMPKIGAGRMNL